MAHLIFRPLSITHMKFNCYAYQNWSLPKTPRMTTSKESQRPALFISHATPEDNHLVKWLGTKLSARGYEVWADVMRLKEGLDWSPELEQALRNQVCKMLLVCTPVELQKQGVRN